MWLGNKSTVMLQVNARKCFAKWRHCDQSTVSITANGIAKQKRNDFNSVLIEHHRLRKQHILQTDISLPALQRRKHLFINTFEKI